MQEEIRRQVMAALSVIQQPGPAGNVVHTVSPSHRPSSCASTGLPDVDIERPLPVDNVQRYPVDEITQRTSCELHRPFGNISLKVAHGMALPVQLGQTNHGMEIPNGYYVVGVE
ncbi:unnamed protein product [Urochloa humidicola]